LCKTCGAVTLPEITHKDRIMIEKRDFYINGTWIAPAQPRDCQVIDPATEEAVAVISLGGQADTDAAVAAAKAAFPAWAALTPQERAGYCAGILDQYRKREGEMAEAIRAEMGAPIGELGCLAAGAVSEGHFDG
jgi:aldehyde dehydrogenase (NAD+)